MTLHEDLGKPFGRLAGWLDIHGDRSRNLEHVIQLIGIDHVGIGPDFVDYWLRESQLLLGERDPLGSELDTKGVEYVTKIPYFTAALMKRGYSEGEISKILGENFLTLFKKVLGVGKGSFASPYD